MQILIVIREVLSTPALFVGLVTLFGLLLQKKSIDHVIKGTSIAIIGFVLLSAGSDFLQNGALKDFGVLFNYDFHIQGVIPNMEAIASIGMAEYATQISQIMLFGMIANIIMARFGPFRYIFLTGHHTLYMACLLAIVLHRSGMKNWQITLASSLMLGFLMAAMPAMIQKEVETVTGGNKIALGHFSSIGYIVAAKTACLVSRREQNRKTQQSGNKSTEDIKFPTKLSFMRDSVVGIFVVMTIVFLLLTGIAVSGTNLAVLDISYQAGGYQNWVIYAIVQGAQFSAAIYVILAGVRLIIAEIVPAFKGIAKKIVPDAKPAVDCPILFPYAPNAVMIGFLVSFLGGIITMLILMAMNAAFQIIFIPVIVPGVVAHFFCGASAGVFANAEGGVKGCVAGAFVHGILITLLSLAVMPVTGAMNISGTTFSDTDYCVAGVLLGNLSKIMSGNGIFTICILCFVIPIVWEQIRVMKIK